MAEQAVKVLVVEDQADLRMLVQDQLESAGYEVFMAEDGESGIRLAERERPAIVLLDLMLPGMSGLDVLRILKDRRMTKHTPVIIVSAKDAVADIKVGLDAGADDYLGKPFHYDELLARIEAVLRRSADFRKGSATIETLVHGPISLNSQTCVATLEGSRLKLTRTEFVLLEEIVKAQGAVLSRDELLFKVHGPCIVTVERNIDVHIASLRRKLKGHAHIIATVRGVGYRLDV